MNTRASHPHRFEPRATLAVALFTALVLVPTQAVAFPGEEVEAIAGDHAIVDHAYRTPSQAKTWIVERTTWPNPGLLRKINPGVIVRVLRTGIHHDGEWLRVETIDAQRTRGLAMAHLLVPARDEDVRNALRAERDALDQALLAARAEQQRLADSAQRAIDEALALDRARQAELARLERAVPTASAPVSMPSGVRLAASALETAVSVMRAHQAPSEGTAVTALSVPTTPTPPTAVPLPRAPVAAVRPIAPVSARPLAAPRAVAAKPQVAGAATPAQAAPASATHAPTASAPSAAAVAAPRPTAASETAAPVETFEASMAPPEPVLAIGQADPRAAMEAARSLPAVAWGRILLVVMLLVGGAAGAIYYHEHRGERATELVTLSSVPLARDASLSLVRASGRTLVVGTTSAGVQLVTDLASEALAGTTTDAFLRHHVAPSLAESRPTPLSRLLREDRGGGLASKPEPVRRLAAASRKVFGGGASR